MSAIVALAAVTSLAACGSDSGGTGVNTGSIMVSAATTGADVDSTGYSVVVDGGSGHAVGITDSVTLSAVAAGSHQVALTSVGSNCTVSPSDTQTVTVSTGAAAAVSFQVTCVLRQIVFSSFPADSGNILTIKDDGTGSAVLASSSSFDGLPSWSPNRTLVAFASSRQHSGHGFDIWVVKPDNTGLQRITTDPGENGLPAWSPDGSKIAFASTRTDQTVGHAEIWAMDAAGTNEVQLTHDDALANAPAWSPDGSQIAYQSNAGGGTTQIWVMNADGSNAHQLTNDAFNDASPSWSPAGMIVFQSDRDRTQSDSAQVEVYVMKDDGTGAT
ncbi:MAG: TolB family protein, partial [Gemmatimonadaceae bacterium]